MEKIYTWTTPTEAVKAEGEYWRSRSVEERVAAVETIRRATMGVYDDAAARLERVHWFVELEPRALRDRGRTRAGGKR